MLDNKGTIYVHVKRAQVAQCRNTHTRTHTYRMRACWAVGVARSLAIVKIAGIIHVLPATEITTTTRAAKASRARAEHQRRHSIEANAQNANYAMIYISIDIF